MTTPADQYMDGTIEGLGYPQRMMDRAKRLAAIPYCLECGGFRVVHRGGEFKPCPVCRLPKGTDRDGEA